MVVDAKLELKELCKICPFEVGDDVKISETVAVIGFVSRSVEGKLIAELVSTTARETAEELVVAPETTILGIDVAEAAVMFPSTGTTELDKVTRRDVVLPGGDGGNTSDPAELLTLEMDTKVIIVQEFPAEMLVE